MKTDLLKSILAAILFAAMIVTPVSSPRAHVPEKCADLTVYYLIERTSESAHLKTATPMMRRFVSDIKTATRSEVVNMLIEKSELVQRAMELDTATAKAIGALLKCVHPSSSDE